MALNSAICFELFSLAALAVRPGRGLMVVLTSDTTGGAMARRLLPAAILIPLILGAGFPFWLGGITKHIEQVGISERMPS